MFVCFSNDKLNLALLQAPIPHNHHPQTRHPQTPHPPIFDVFGLSVFEDDRISKELPPPCDCEFDLLPRRCRFRSEREDLLLRPERDPRLGLGRFIGIDWRSRFPNFLGYCVFRNWCVPSFRLFAASGQTLGVLDSMWLWSVRGLKPDKGRGCIFDPALGDR